MNEKEILNHDLKNIKSALNSEKQNSCQWLKLKDEEDLKESNIRQLTRVISSIREKVENIKTFISKQEKKIEDSEKEIDKLTKQEEYNKLSNKIAQLAKLYPAEDSDLEIKLKYINKLNEELKET